MNVTAETLTILIFLIPGFISSGILNTFLTRRNVNNTSRIVEALIFSLIIYTTVSTTIGQSAVLLVEERIAGTARLSIQYNPKVVWSIIIASIILPFCIVVLFKKDVHTKLLRKKSLRWLKIPTLQPYDNMWVGVFMKEERYVTVNLRDGRRIFGWPRYYSVRPQDGMLYLYHPAWIDANKKYVELDIHGILLNREDITSIEFTTVSRRNAQPAKPKEANNVQREGI